MATPLSSVQGLASNIQWQDLVTAVMNQEKSRLLDPVTNAISAAKSGVDAWTQFQTLVKTVNTSALALRDGAVGSVAAVGGTTAGGRALFSATAAAGATPGNYEAEVVSLARASKVAGATFADPSAAVGVTGAFIVNGKRIVVSATDSLATIRDAINRANVGNPASGVSATIATTLTGGRLVLVSTMPGASGIELTDGPSGVLRSLGLTDGTLGSTTAQPQSYRFSDATKPIGDLLAETDLPAAATISVGNKTISVDLSTDTLADLEERIAAAGVNANLVTTQYNGSSWQRIEVGEPVGAVANNPDSARIVALLGFGQPGQSSVTQVLADASPWTDGGGAPATGATALSSLAVGGTALGLAAGDTIQINGHRGDGIAVSASLKLTGSETVDSLLAKLNASAVFGAVSRSATASIAADGTLTVTDDTAGSSQLSLSLAVKRADGTTASLGQVGTRTAGFDRVLVQGSDAQVRVDGTLYSGSSNTFTSAIPNVTLDLTAAEPGTTVDLTLARDQAGAATAIKTLADAYNELASFVKKQTASGGALQFSTIARSSLRELSKKLQENVPGLTGDLTRGALVGLAFDKNGQLLFNEDTFKKAFIATPDQVLALFGTAKSVQDDNSVITTTGIGGAVAKFADALSRAGDGVAASQISSLQARMSELDRRSDDIQTRIDRHRDTMTAQFVAMEAALARLQSQGAVLTSQIKGLQSSNR
jgi:flagellar hook-associated protein 2